MNLNSKLYTAAQIARSLGRSKRVIARDLERVTPSGALMVKGNAANAWEFCALPSQIQSELLSEARRRGYANAETLLERAPGQWKPPVSLSDLKPEAITKAVNLRDAMRPALGRMNDLSLSSGELEALGLQSFCKTFGTEVTARYWRELFRRTIERDDGAEDWERLELYVDDRAFQAKPKRLGARVSADEFETLSALIALVKDPARPSEAEKRNLWVKSFELVEEAMAEGQNGKRFKGRLIRFLFERAPFLSATEPALRRAFNEKYDRWSKGETVKDKRLDKSGHYRGPELTEAQWNEEIDRVISHAVFRTGGRIAQAYRELRNSRELCPELLTYYPEGKSKSYVPKRIIEAARADVRIVFERHKGPRNHQLRGAYLSRNWNNVPANAVHQMDDVTLPVYYYEPNDEGWFDLTRGQLLLYIDSRSLKILGYSVISAKNYSSFKIHTTITRVADEYGLPKMFYFERGIWKSSKLLKGSQKEAALSWNETEPGFREFGVKFVHAKLPRGKTIERVIGLLQDRMEGEPGYVGRNEIVDKYERVQKQMLMVKTKKLHPSEAFYSADQWEQRLAELCEDYNAAAQDGKILGGLSPDEAFERFQDPQDPPIRFDANTRYLLAHSKFPLTVTRNGITLRIGANEFNYRNEQTGTLIGEKVLAWFNPESPEILTVTDLNRENPFCVMRSQSVPAFGASPELLRAEMGKINAHQAYAKTRYRVLKPKAAITFRRNLVAPATRALGNAIEEQSSELRTRTQEKETIVRRNQRKASRMGYTLPPEEAARPGAAEDLEKLRQWLDETKKEAGL